MASDTSLPTLFAKTTRRNRELEAELQLFKSTLQDMQLDRIELLRKSDRDYGNVLRRSLWGSEPIEVHWENPSPDNIQERSWVKAAVARTWEKHSRLRFTGWDAATPSSKGIRIRIAEEGPHCKRLGRYLDGMKDGMVLNFTFQTWCRDCGDDRQESIEKIAVHEFGHAIGFAHEQNREDAPDWCQVERQGTNGDWHVTLYDPYSIMNYCNPTWNNDGLLSVRDIEALQTIYGKPE